jgi:hypothetical protein
VRRAVAYLGPGGRGGSRPLLLRLEDGGVAHVKLQGNEQSTRTLVGEWIAGTMARRLRVPVPELVLVDLPFEALGAVPQLTRRRWRPGLQFGTRYVADARPVRGREMLATLANLDVLPLVALFEGWLYNSDLKGSHILAAGGRPGPTFFVTDHGFVFPRGPRWSQADLYRERDGIPNLTALTVLAQAASTPFSFKPALAAMAGIGEPDVEQAVASLPPGWGLPGDAARAVVDFLSFRLTMLPSWAETLSWLWRGAPRGPERR